MNTPNTRFQRANFVVSNLERSLTFYRDVLGFEVTFQKGHNPDSYSFELFDIPEQAQLGFAILSLKDQPRVMALTEVFNIPEEPPQHPRQSAIVLHVDELDQVVEASRALGLEVFREEILETHDGRKGREIGIVDFDDNLVLVYRIG